LKRGVWVLNTTSHLHLPFDTLTKNRCCVPRRTSFQARKDNQWKLESLGRMNGENNDTSCVIRHTCFRLSFAGLYVVKKEFGGLG